MMRFIFALVLCVTLSVSGFAQMFNTGQTLKEKTFAVGLNPIFFEAGDDYKFGIYFHGGFGLTHGLDINVKFGILDETNYLGADLEYMVYSSGPYFSITGGGHLMGNDGLDNFGIDLGANLTFPISSQLDLFGAIDTDINFVDVYKNGKEETETVTCMWIPLGLEYKLKRNAAFVLEADIAVNDDAYNIFGGGLVWYFN